MIGLVFKQVLSEACSNVYTNLGYITVSDSATIWCDFAFKNQTCNLIWSEKENFVENITEECKVITKDSTDFYEGIIYHHFNFFIRRGGTFSFYIYNCTPEINETNVNSMGTFHFQNKWGYLPPRVFPIMIYSCIESAYFVGLLIAGIVNKCHHPLIVVSLHNLVLLTVTATFVSSFAIALTLSVSNSFFSNVTLPIVYSFRAIKLMLICILCISIAMGVSIVVENPTKKDIGISILCSFLFALAQFFTMFTITSSNNSVLIITSGVSFILFYCIYCATFSNYISTTLKILHENMVQIAEMGIDPFTTPTFRKIKMVNRLRKIAIIILVIDLMSGLAYSLFTSSLYIIYIIGSILEAGFFTYMSWEVRIRKRMAATYLDNEDAYIVPNNQEDKIQWEFGMAIPKLPTEAHDMKKIFADDHLYE